ncbi:MAG: tRNA lysidine(34) synthetase TilS, partial [Armatimonadota bacterium]
YIIPMNIISSVYQYNLINKNSKILVAYSGGPDSSALLHSLISKKNEFDIEIVCAHLNHNIRGKESDDDEAFVIEQCGIYGIEIITESIDVPKLKSEQKGSLEEIARNVRKKFLEKTAKRINADYIATGHNADDRIETLLFNLLRGTGITGLASIKPRNGIYIRPLINTYRADIEKYIEENNIAYRIDSTNASNDYTRNLIRNDLIPKLINDYNPQLKSALTRLANISNELDFFIELQSSLCINNLCFQDGLDARRLSQLPQAISSKIIRTEIERVKDNTQVISFNHIQEIVDLLCIENDFKISLPSENLYAICKNNIFKINKELDNKNSISFQTPLLLSGETNINSVGVKIISEYVDNPDYRKSDEYTAYIDMNKINGNLTITSKKDGDRFVPLGMKESKKLQDVFVDKKIKEKNRHRIAILRDDEKIVWVAGVGISDEVKLDSNSDKILKLVAVYNPPLY